MTIIWIAVLLGVGVTSFILLGKKYFWLTVDQGIESRYLVSGFVILVCFTLIVLIIFTERDVPNWLSPVLVAVPSAGLVYTIVLGKVDTKLAGKSKNTKATEQDHDPEGEGR